MFGLGFPSSAIPPETFLFSFQPLSRAPPCALVSDPTQSGGGEGRARQFSHNLEFHGYLHGYLAAALSVKQSPSSLRHYLWVFLRLPSLLGSLSNRSLRTFFSLCVSDGASELTLLWPLVAFLDGYKTTPCLLSHLNDPSLVLGKHSWVLSAPANWEHRPLLCSPAPTPCCLPPQPRLGPVLSSSL